MIIFPAVDLYGKCAVRLLKGNYNKMTVYSSDPAEIAQKFESLGASHIHIVDLEGARDGTTPNVDSIESIIKKTSLFIEVGGGIRDIDTAERYFSLGVSRIILGTAAVTDRAFLCSALEKYGDKISVGADILNGSIAIKGWLEKSDISVYDFFTDMSSLGVKNIICTDISKDGAMHGTNLKLYEELSERYRVDITASGGISDMSDLLALREMDIYGAIVGKAYYTGAIDLHEAIEAVK